MKNIIKTIATKAGYNAATISIIYNHAENMDKNSLNIPFDENGRFFYELSSETSGWRNAYDLLRSCEQSKDFEIRKGIWLYTYYSDNGYLKLNVSVQETEFSALEKYNLEWNSCFKIYPEDIIKNKITIPELGIDMKAIKFIQKYKIASKESIDDFNKSNSGNKKRYFCISKNPIDFIMASTNQSFTSCLSFESTYQRSYYLSLPAMIADVNRYICYITDKKISKYQIFDLEIDHYRYQQRNWLIADTDGNVFLDRYYPANIYNVSDILTDIGLSESNFKFSKTVPFDTGFFESKSWVKPMIYLDTLGIELNEDEEWQYISASGNQGDLSPDCRIVEAFCEFSGRIDDYDIRENQKSVKCYCCDCRITSDADTYYYDGNVYCESCYDDLAICCHCDCICDRDDTYYQNNIGYICESCLDRHYVFCDFCNRYHKKSDTTETENHGYVCNYQLHRLFKFCDVCQKWHKIDESVFVYLDHEQEYVCQDCVADYAIKCQNCKSWHKKEKAIKILSPVEYANDYYCYSCHVFRHESCNLTFEAA